MKGRRFSSAAKLPGAILAIRARSVLRLSLAAGSCVLAGCGGSDFTPGAGNDASTATDAGDEIIIVTSDATAADAGIDAGSTDAGAPPEDSSTREGGDAGCPAPTTLDCNGTCVDPTKPEHCGSCMNACEGPDSGAGTPTCTNGKCGLGCTAPTSLDCSGSCVDPTGVENCGVCGNTCKTTAGTGTPQCTVGGDGGRECTVTCDGTTTMECGTACYSPTDPNHCGSCTASPCPAPTNGNGVAACTGTACTVACNSGFHACGNNTTCESNADDPSNANDPCILSSQFGVFVATTASGGSDTLGNGTPSKPFATISHALANLGGTTRVYVCNGSYSDQVTVTSPVSIYGALTCTGGTWAYAMGTSPVVTSTSATGGPALTISGVSGAVLVEDMTFESQSATGVDSHGNGNSSIAAWVNGSSGVQFVRTKLQAGNGVAGQDQSQAPQASAAPTGNAGDKPINQGGTGNGGGAQPNPLCSTSLGGGGGSAHTMQVDGQTGQPGANNAGTSMGCNMFPAQGGGSGASGSIGTTGSGAASVGTLGAAGWVPTAGQSGETGTLGQGGGGGGAGGVLNAVGGGGGGGAGGCGGSGGAPGTGGGASIAVLVFNSAIALVNPTLVSGTAGRGGDGAAGQLGQPGGAGGTPGAASCNGGAGGAGGNGGPGGGGAGGVSAGLLWSGTAPTINGVSTPSATTLAGVTVGFGGVAGTGPAGNNGVPGQQAAVLQAP